MKVTLVLLLALGVVSADVGLGYHYKVPSTSYGYPSYRSGNYDNSGQFSQTVSSSSGIGSSFYQASNSVSGNVVKPQYRVGTGSQTQYATSSQFQSAAAQNNYQDYYQVQQAPAQVYKHFYVHTAPEESEPIRPRVPVVLPPPQKHYKIIFVKTPSPAAPPRVIAPIPPQTEEKTIVYVLLKKPEEQQEVILPKTEVKPPSKPEVFFINYSDKQDSQAVINRIVEKVNSGSEGFASGQSNVQYQTPINQAFGLSTAGDASVAVAQASSGTTYPISSTSSSTTYDAASSLSTSQGVPHETYGSPKFRAN